MANRCVGNFGESGTELNVSETVQEIINILHSDEKPLHKVVYDVQSGQFGFVFDDGRLSICCNWVRSLRKRSRSYRFCWTRRSLK